MATNKWGDHAEVCEIDQCATCDALLNQFRLARKVWKSSAHQCARPERTPTPAVRLIAAERERQMAVEGWTPEHDARHDHGELCGAAMCYIANREITTDEEPPLGWPWDWSWWKPSDPIRNLVKAGALVAAEIDRLLLAVRPSPPEPRCICTFSDGARLRNPDCQLPAHRLEAAASTLEQS